MRHCSPLLAVLLLLPLPAQSIREELAPKPFPSAESLLMAQRMATGSGLAWLARQQQQGGHWTGSVGHKQMDDYLVFTTEAEQARANTGHVGITALAGMAFLAAGHLPDRGPYGTEVRRTVDYVVRCVAENGFITDSSTRMYSHAFATLFLAQVLGMVPDPQVRQSLEKACHLIVDSQNSLGAWRYNLFSRDADLSVTVCQLQALRAARNVGIQVQKACIDRAVEYVNQSQVQRGYDRGLYSYKIAGRGAFEKNRQYAVNAAAMTSLFSAGVHDPDRYGPVLKFLDDEYPYLVRRHADHYYFWYGSFYASQAYFQAGGSWFTGYHQKITTDLLRLQREDGRWVNNVGPGDAFSTAVACLILSIPQQYLPIFQR